MRIITTAKGLGGRVNKFEIKRIKYLKTTAANGKIKLNNETRGKLAGSKQNHVTKLTLNTPARRSATITDFYAKSQQMKTANISNLITWVNIKHYNLYG